MQTPNARAPPDLQRSWALKGGGSSGVCGIAGGSWCSILACCPLRVGSFPAFLASQTLRVAQTLRNPKQLGFRAGFVMLVPLLPPRGASQHHKPCAKSEQFRASGVGVEGFGVEVWVEGFGDCGLVFRGTLLSQRNPTITTKTTPGLRNLLAEFVPNFDLYRGTSLIPLTPNP